jgi:hypothetical protein
MLLQPLLFCRHFQLHAAFSIFLCYLPLSNMDFDVVATLLNISNIKMLASFA